MRIGFDISQTGAGKAGCGYFADSLVQHLAVQDQANSYLLYSCFGNTFWDPAHARTTRRLANSNFSRTLTNLSQGACANLFKDTGSGRELEKHLGNPDIIHANNFFCPKNLQNSRLVYTLYDLHFLENPEWTTETNRCLCFDGLFNASIYADMIIAISRFSKKHFLEFFPYYPEERIEVVHLGSRFPLNNRKGGPPWGNLPEKLARDRFWLAVGTLEPRKNLRRLLKAFANVKQQRGLQFTLAIAGGTGWLEEGLTDYIRDLDIEENISLLGYVTDTQLDWLYRNCFAFIYPSLFEGFGLPVLEAMSSGAAVITSNTSSIPEITGSAAMTISPADVAEIENAIATLATDLELRKRLKVEAGRQAKNFSWEKTARKVLELYDTVVTLPFWNTEQRN